MLMLAGDFLRTLWRAMGRRRAAAIGLLSLGLLLEAGLLTLLIPTIQSIVQPGHSAEGGGWAKRFIGTSGTVPGVGHLVLLLIAVNAITFVRTLLANARDLRLLRTQLGFADGERRRLMRALAFSPWTRVAGLDHARLTSTMTNEIQRLSSSAQSVLQCCVALPSILLHLGFALALAPAFAAAVLGLALCGAVALLLGQRALYDLGGAITESNRAAVANLRALLGTLKTAAAQQSQSELVAEFDAVQREAVDRQISFRQRRYRRRLLFTAVLSVVGMGILLLGLGVFHLTPALLIMMILLFARMALPAMQIAGTAQTLVYSLPALRALRTLEAELGHAATPPVAAVAPLPDAALVLDHISYAHSDGAGINAINLRIEPGLIHGIAGRSGQGKTTLIDVIAGLLPPAAGSLRLGEVALVGAALTGWHRQLAYVPQESYLFPDTIRRNLSWANAAGVDDAALHSAIATVDASALVARLGGLDGVVGERGIGLSGGERQRLVLARALLRRPRWLLLDEATNALDEAAEAALIERLRALVHRPTILLVSHRDRLLALCDTLVRIEHGSVVAEEISAV